MRGSLAFEALSRCQKSCRSKIVFRILLLITGVVLVVTGWLGVTWFSTLQREATAVADLLEEVVTMQATSATAVAGKGSAIAVDHMSISAALESAHGPADAPGIMQQPDARLPGSAAAAVSEGTGDPAGAAVDPDIIAPIFTREVRHWAPQILIWATEYDLDPDVIATLIQIESCGDPAARSSAGAQGLFQVMPHHFTAGDNMFDPEINAERGLTYFREGLRIHGGDLFRTFAGYNAGHDVARRDRASWPAETQKYYYWSMGIYVEARAGLPASPTLEEWLRTFGDGLCRQAAVRLGLPLLDESNR